MRNFFMSVFAAILGGLIVFLAMNYTAPTKVKETSGVVRNKATDVKASPVKYGTLTPQQIYENYSDAVVHVRAEVSSRYDNFFGLRAPDNQISSGSGFIVSGSGYVITNAHVVGDADNVKIQFSDKAEVPARVIGVDQSTDIALLKADIGGHKYKVLTIGDSGGVKVGQPVYAIGNPLGLDRSMSSGIVSAINREITAPNNFPIRDVIQTDTAINRGSSGGPLISSTGKVIGVTAQIATEGAGNIGIAFAIPSSTVKKIFDEIRQSGTASHPWIGIQGATLFEKMAKELKLKVDDGAMVIATLRPSPSQKAGLKGADQTLRIGQTTYEVGGDVIIELNKAKITSMDDLIREINRLRAGEKIKLTVVDSNNKTRVVELQLEERPAETPFPR